MANWITPNAADVLNNQPAALVTAYRSAALGAGQTDPLPFIIADVTTTIRRKVGSSPLKFTVDADTTKIPAGLKQIAVVLIVAALAARLLKPLTADQTAAVSAAQRDLDRIADGKDTIETPDDPTPAPIQTGGAIEVASASHRQFTRRGMRGI